MAFSMPIFVYMFAVTPTKKTRQSFWSKLLQGSLTSIIFDSLLKVIHSSHPSHLHFYPLMSVMFSTLDCLPPSGGRLSVQSDTLDQTHSFWCQTFRVFLGDWGWRGTMQRIAVGGGVLQYLCSFWLMDLSLPLSEQLSEGRQSRSSL